MAANRAGLTQALALMKLFAAIRAFLNNQQNRGWWASFCVVSSESGFTVTELRRRKPSAIQSAAWNDIDGVCFKDGGLGCDRFFIFIRDCQEPIMVPVEASGGLEFWNQSKERLLFPQEISGQCVQSSATGAEFWWPPEMSANNSFKPTPLRGAA